MFLLKKKHKKEKKLHCFPLRTAVDSEEVNSISFERNGLFMNGILYSAGGISGYSRFINTRKLLCLEEIKPPFLMNKGANNNTLSLIKEDRKYYLTISEELKYAEKNNKNT